MKLLWVSLCLSLTFAGAALAAEVSFAWTPNTDDPSILGLNIYQNDWGNEVAHGLPDSGEATIEADLSGGNKHTFWATYFNADGESKKSDDAEAWKTGSSVGTVGGFTVTVNVVPN